MLPLLVIAVMPLRAAIPSGWHTNTSEALKLATEKKQPVLVYFTADWCGPCKAMAAGTLKDKDTLETLTFFQAAAINIDLNKDLAQQFGVGSVPTFVLLDQAGDELDRTTGYMEAGLFRAWLASGMARFERAQIQRQKDLEQQQRLAADLVGNDAAKKNKALQELFALCARREQSQQKFALAQLQALAAREPALLLPALDHPRLATRLQAANLLRDKLGEVFQFDPWARPEARRAALAELQHQFGAASRK
jgi:thioredoxin-like negative regulator of GroEL